MPSRFGLKYPNFTTETLLSSTTQRVIDSMYFFAQGRFGREAEDKDLLTVNDIPGPVSWITPWNSCPGIDWHYASKASKPGFNSCLITYHLLRWPMNGATRTSLKSPNA